MTGPGFDSDNAVGGYGLTVARRMRTIAIVGAVIGIILGVIALVWPGATLLTVALLLGIGVIVGGVHRLMAAFAFGALPTGARWMLGILGVLMIVAGFMAVANPAGTLLFLAIFIGAAWAVGGVFDIAAGISGATTGPRWWAFVSGALGILAAIAVWMLPGVALATFVLFGGILLIVVSVATLVVLPKVPGKA